MAQVASRDTTPEYVVRRLLSSLGVRYRLNVKSLPGKPDIVVKRWNLIILVHGCFWHRHDGCRRCTTPKSNRAYWHAKFRRNVERDEEVRLALKKAGWRVFTVWECETLRDGRERRALLRRLTNVCERCLDRERQAQ